ncbi:MAG: FKBP-type peptidyl-prolyl cis-trans isomerase [Bacteroidetes bacterium]|nr:FKBP-type peptidyl-prolyl cis-trans isomerase [Bacteroidota bacterium]
MKKIAALALSATVVLASCTDTQFKKGKDGLEYKIISKGSGSKVNYGEFMDMAVATFYNTGKTDSVLSDTRTNGNPVIEPFDSLNIPKAYLEVLSQMKKGDSAVFRILSDSAFKKMPDQMPPFIKKGHYLITTIKLLDIYKTKEEATKARETAMQNKQKLDSINAIAQQAKDDKTLQDYFAKNNIKPVKAPKGTYVQVIAPGTGNNIDTSCVVKVMYTGRTLEGKVFDSNMDSSRGRTEPLTVNLTNDPSLGMTVIQGWNDGFTQLNKGAKAKLFIPSPLAYGARAAGPDIPANSILMFDVEIVDVLNKAQAKEIADAERKKMMDMQKHYMDSVSKVQKAKVDTAKKK